MLLTLLCELAHTTTIGTMGEDGKNHFSPVKTEVIFLPSVVYTYSTFQCVFSLYTLS